MLGGRSCFEGFARGVEGRLADAWRRPGGVEALQGSAEVEVREVRPAQEFARTPKLGVAAAVYDGTPRDLPSPVAARFDQLGEVGECLEIVGCRRAARLRLHEHELVTALDQEVDLDSVALAIEGELSSPRSVAVPLDDL